MTNLLKAIESACRAGLRAYRAQYRRMRTLQKKGRFADEF